MKTYLLVEKDLLGCPPPPPGGGEQAGRQAGTAEAQDSSRAPPGPVNVPDGQTLLRESEWVGGWLARKREWKFGHKFLLLSLLFFYLTIVRMRKIICYLKLKLGNDWVKMSHYSFDFISEIIISLFKVFIIYLKNSLLLNSHTKAHSVWRPSSSIGLAVHVVRNLHEPFRANFNPLSVRNPFEIQSWNYRHIIM